MKNKVWFLFFIGVIAIPLLAFSAVRWYDNNMATLPYYYQGTSVESENVKHFTVPDFAFVNQDSSALNSHFIKGKVWVINYFFTSCPTICPKMMANMQSIQKAFSKDDRVRLISLTVDPDHDTPAKLKRYSTLKHIDVLQWRLGTGSKEELYGFARHGLFITTTDGDGGVGDFIHSEKIILVDRQNHIRGYYDGTDADDVNQLIKDIARLKKSSS
jgi:protein SCO1/2